MTHSQATAASRAAAGTMIVPTQRGDLGHRLDRRDNEPPRSTESGAIEPRAVQQRQRHGRDRKPGRRIVDLLRLIVAVPLVAVVGFAGLALLGTAQQVSRMGELHDQTLLAVDAGALAHALQGERAAAAGVLVGGTAAQVDDLARFAAVTDSAVRAYRERRSIVNDEQAGTGDLLRRVDAGLDSLTELRRQVRTSPQASVSAVAFTYRILVADLLEYRASVARSGAPAAIADTIRAASALSVAIESIGLQQVSVLRAVAANELTPAVRQEITATRTSFVEATESFTELAKPEWRAWYEQASVGEDVVAAQRLQDEVGRTMPGGRVAIDPGPWIVAMGGWAARLFDVQQRVDRAIVADVSALRARQIRQAMIQAGGVAIAMIVAVVLTSIVARRITRRLKQLHDAARVVAYQRLPAVVSQLRGAPPGTVRPDEVAERSAADVVIDGSDEITEVAQAFRAVHREAVRIAGEQAVMRSNVAEIFVHLSRREQRLVDAVLAQVDRVERDETDPDRLQQLYQLDHLATRMARINLSLLVLGGSGAARVRREDAPLVKVLQAAISQIEHYTRVRFGMVDDDVAVVAEAVDEIVHLLAELVDNATGYSPPESEVWVTGRALGDRIIIQVGDEGVGLPPPRRAQLNQLLASPPPIDVAAVRAMGLTVVGHIAARYGIRVELRPSQGGGTIAEVTLPAGVFRPILAVERQLPFGPITLDQPHSMAGTGQVHAAPVPVKAELFTRPAEHLVSAGAPAPAPAPAGAVPGGPAPGGAPGPGAWPPMAAPVRSTRPAAAADETAELPIFQSVNGWFRTGTTSAAPAAPINWETPADEGWRAAAQAATPDIASTTASGLPVRAPQRQLVPGAPANPPQPPNAAKRDPSAVAAAMSAYARGVAGRRGTPVQ